MKLKLFSLIFFSVSLLACDSSSIAVLESSDDNDSSTVLDDTDSGGVDVDNADDGSSNADGSSGADGGSNATFTGPDGVTTSRTANGVVNSVALIKLEPIGVNVDSTRGLFGDLPETSTEEEVRDWYITSEDRCGVSVLINGSNSPDGFVVVDQMVPLVSAGESLVLTDENGTYATLQRIDESDGPRYLPQADIQQSAGANLQISIPGDQFSAFAGIAVPTVPEIQLATPNVDENVGVATFFQWEPNNVPGSVIELYVGGFSSVRNESIFIGCALVDDGLFAFPEEVQAQMGPDFDDGFTSLLRTVYNVAAADDSMVFITNSVRRRISE